MADPQLDRLLGSLGASFEAQLIRQEEDAAADLAMSLSQDVCLRDELGRCGAVAAILGDGVRAPVRAIGADVIITTGAIAALVPLGRAVVRATPGRPPTTSDATFVGTLRGWARAGAQVEVAASEGRFLGRLRRCGRDYVVVAQGESDALVALDAIAWVRLVRGDSADRANDFRPGDRDLGCCAGSTDRDRSFCIVECMRKRGLLTTPSRERGSAVVESIFAIIFLMLIALCVIELVFALYSRNVLAAAAHEGARAGIELGRDPSSAAAIAQRTVERSAGELVSGLRVSTEVERAGSESIVTVDVTGHARSFGPIPFPLTFHSVARDTGVMRVP